MTEEKQPQFLIALVLVYIFFSLAESVSIYWFPDFGASVYTLVTVYFGAIIALLALATHYKREIPKLPLLGVSINFLIFVIPFYLFFFNLFVLVYPRTDTTYFLFIAIPTVPAAIVIVQELIISISENYIAFVQLPEIIPWGKQGTAKAEYIKTVRGFPFGMVIPDAQKLKRGIPSLIFITMLHTGAYARNATNVPEFLIGIAIVFIMFSVFWIIKETFGFGSSEAGHWGWNTALTNTRGSII